jgi:hypothetical protein
MYALLCSQSVEASKKRKFNHHDDDDDEPGPDGGGDATAGDKGYGGIYRTTMRFRDAIMRRF